MEQPKNIPEICKRTCPAVCNILDQLGALKIDMAELDRSRGDSHGGDATVIADILNMAEQIEALEATLQQLGQTCIQPQHLTIFMGNNEQQEVTACTSPQAYDNEHPVLNVVTD